MTPITHRKPRLLCLFLFHLLKMREGRRWHEKRTGRQRVNEKKVIGGEGERAKINKSEEKREQRRKKKKKS